MTGEIAKAHLPKPEHHKHAANVEARMITYGILAQASQATHPNQQPVSNAEVPTNMTGAPVQAYQHKQDHSKTNHAHTAECQIRIIDSMTASRDHQANLVHPVVTRTVHTRGTHALRGARTRTRHNKQLLPSATTRFQHTTKARCPNTCSKSIPTNNHNNNVRANHKTLQK
jgi:hypothetical protein